MYMCVCVYVCICVYVCGKMSFPLKRRLITLKDPGRLESSPWIGQRRTGQRASTGRRCACRSIDQSSSKTRNRWDRENINASCERVNAYHSCAPPHRTHRKFPHSFYRGIGVCVLTSKMEARRTTRRCIPSCSSTSCAGAGPACESRGLKLVSRVYARAREQRNGTKRRTQFINAEDFDMIITGARRESHESDRSPLARRARLLATHHHQFISDILLAQALLRSFTRHDTIHSIVKSTVEGRFKRTTIVFFHSYGKLKEALAQVTRL